MEPAGARAAAAALIGLAGLFSGCGRGGLSACHPRAQAPSRGEFSVMTYNLHRFGFHDRDGDGQANDPKPRQERDAVVAVLRAEHPDILAIQEMGSPPAFQEFRRALGQAGLDYPHVEYLQQGDAENNLAVLSRWPLVARRSRTNDSYRIGDTRLPVARGFIDVEIEVDGRYRFRLLAAHLKSKEYAPLGQTEMRRNEARLLHNHVRGILDADPRAKLLVAGNLNDDIDSAALREAVGRGAHRLFALRPTDCGGDAWTWHNAAKDSYHRMDYLLLSPGMRPALVEAKTHVTRHPLAHSASDHRPVVGVFRADDGRTAREGP